MGRWRGIATAFTVAASLVTGSITVGTTPVIEAASDTTRLVPLEPCRLADTRSGDGISTISGRRMTIRLDHCGIPGDATAIVATTTVIFPQSRGYLVGYPAGTAEPNSATLNWTAGRTWGNSTTITVGDDRSIEFYKSDGFGTGNVTVDVTAAFVPAAEATAGRFVPLTAGRRLLDTRSTATPAAGDVTTVPIPDGIPADATALAVTLTATDTTGRGFFTLYPSGGERPEASALNTDGVGQFRSATTIVPVGELGFDIYQSIGADVIVDMTGWFTGESATSSADGLFVPLAPTRLRDTRPEASPIHPGGSIEIPIDHDAAAVALSMTMADPDTRGYITAHAARTDRSETASGYGFPLENTAQFALTAVSDTGLSVFSANGTELTVDLLGWFTGTPAPETNDSAAPNPVPRQQVLAIGDSSMAGVDRTFANGALQGADFTFLARSCRRLVRESCNGREGPIPPPTAYQTLSGVGYKQFDVLVMMTGYNDIMPGFSSDVPQIVALARAKGIRRIVWLTMAREFRTDKGGPGAYQVYQFHNDVIRANAAAHDFMYAIEWSSIIRQVPWWTYSDGIHLDRPGGYGAADLISRSVAHVTGQPCPQPERPGGTTDGVCPDPGTRPPIDVRTLYGI
jgi:hypothetical protein